jgi:hypothetical protein
VQVEIAIFDVADGVKSFLSDLVTFFQFAEINLQCDYLFDEVFPLCFLLPEPFIESLRLRVVASNGQDNNQYD